MTVEVTAEVFPYMFSTKELLNELDLRITDVDEYSDDEIQLFIRRIFTLGKSLTEASKIEYFLDNLESITENDLRTIVENQ